MNQGPYIRPVTLTLIEKKVGGALELTDLGKGFMDRNSEAQELRPAINRKDIIKLIRFCTAKDTVTIMKRQLSER